MFQHEEGHSVPAPGLTASPRHSPVLSSPLSYGTRSPRPATRRSRHRDYRRRASLSNQRHLSPSPAHLPASCRAPAWTWGTASSPRL